MIRAGIAALRAGLAVECRLIVVPHDSGRTPWGWFASLPLGGAWRAVSVEGVADHAAERIRALRPRCAYVVLFSSDEPRGQVLQ